MSTVTDARDWTPKDTGRLMASIYCNSPYAVLTGTPRMAAAIDRLYPAKGRSRSEALLLVQVWEEQFDSGLFTRSALTRAASRRQRRKGRSDADRARATFDKTLQSMLHEGLFIGIGDARQSSNTTAH